MTTPDRNKWASRMYWRTAHERRLIFAQFGPEPSEHDFLIGVMDTAELAREVVEAHNQRLKEGLLDKPATLTIP